jgi:hypothetical protein
MMPGPVKEYEFYIVALTKQGKLVDAYVKATSISNALDKLIDQLDLPGMIVEYRFCVRREKLIYLPSEQ